MSKNIDSILEFGEGVFFKKSQTSSAKWLELELTIISENFYGRKVWDKIFVDGDTPGKSGMPKAKEIGLKTLRRILDSAFNLNSNDNSDVAKSKRQISGIGDLISKEICFKVGVAESNGYSPKNKIKWILTPDDKEYVVGSSYSDYAAPFKRQVFISRIGVYDQYKNLVGLATLSKPILKNDTDDISFKLKMDI